MTPRVLSVMALVLCAACTPLGLYYKSGATVQSAKDAETRCRIEAQRDVPVKPVTRVIYPRPLPPREYCDSDGNCVIRPTVFFPPEYITEDANETLRAQAADLCMREKGFEFLRLPACSNDAAPSSVQQTTRMPRLTEGACVARGQSGSWQIITP